MLDVTMRLPSGENAQLVTTPVWPSSRRQQRARLGVPEPRRLVVARRHDAPAVGRERAAVDVGVALEDCGARQNSALPPVLQDEPAHGRRHGLSSSSDVFRHAERVCRGCQPQDEREEVAQLKDVEDRRGGAARVLGRRRGPAGSTRLAASRGADDHGRTRSESEAQRRVCDTRLGLGLFLGETGLKRRG
ncbi:hypothetical protein M885DRAFT_317668 [Pelagophyceae sp. CCMP2097]|nr:hypothetical protein M885DRAFT_317668 [Pelagophyceae sp. CCMP2097]